MKIRFLSLARPEVLILIITMIALAKVGIAQSNEQTSLVVLAPAHPHGVQMQLAYKSDFARNVAVYGPSEQDMRVSYLNAIERDNRNSDAKERWQLDIYTGPDYFEKMLSEKKGSTVIVASNNQYKADHIKKSSQIGMNVLADKPMAITGDDFRKLELSFSAAQTKGNYVSDLPSMSMRRFVVYLIQKELRANPDVFGELIMGSAENPAILQSNHHYYWKGTTRPTWFFDVRQQGNGLTDVTTHLVDIVQWSGFQAQPIDYRKNIHVYEARTWTTDITPTQFRTATKKEEYSAFLKPYLQDSILHVHANGKIKYTLNDVHVQIVSTWGFKSEDGEGDWYESVMNGSKATLRIKRGNLMDLFIEPTNVDHADLEQALKRAFNNLIKKYPYLSLSRESYGWRIASTKRSVAREAKLIPPSPTEQQNMLAKYYTTTTAHEFFQRSQINKTQ